MLLLLMGQLLYMVATLSQVAVSCVHAGHDGSLGSQAGDTHGQWCSHMQKCPTMSSVVFLHAAKASSRAARGRRTSCHVSSPRMRRLQTGHPMHVLVLW